jgi:hypothetical protein
MTRPLTILAVSLGALLTGGVATAQPLGTFSWQLQPFCNRITVSVTQQGAIYTVDGYDDQCGAAQRAPLVGLATTNPDGTIGFGLNVVTVPGSGGLQIEARVTLPSISGSWSDSSGHSGTFAFGANTGGSPRPAPAAGATIPSAFALLTDGGFLARGTYGTGTIPASNIGTRMMWYPKKAAFRAGEVNFPAWDDVNIGSHSTAFGLNNVAAGAYGFAAGVNSAAIGIASAALGSNAQANGHYSAAFGADTNASGDFAFVAGRNTTAAGYSAAFGNGSTATGTASMAIGSATLATGPYSLAAGVNAIARATSSMAFGNAEVLSNAIGSFAWGDISTSARVQADQPGQFVVRAAGGVRFATNPNQTTGVVMFANASAWSSLSDVHSKEHFRDIESEDLLGRIARMPVREWNYKAQGAAIRHMGPTAQDFRAAFGLGEDPLRISTIDADGVALAAVRALEARTRATNERLTRENDELRARLARLEALLEKR